MNKFASILFIAIAIAHHGAVVVAFTTGSPNNNKAAATTVATLSQQLSTPVSEMPSSFASAQSSSSTTTALNLKVKVDPNAKTKNAAGNAKAAAYGGSIAIAALLPVIFLVWSAIGKGN
eukprot:jgi/Psemu1/289324/fgenesh1_pg.347_\